MKIKELRQKSKEGLKDLLREKRERIDELTFLFSQKKVKNVKEMHGVKKDIARIMALIRESRN